MSKLSRIAKKIKEKKNQKDRDRWKDGKKISVTIRLDEFSIFCLDEICTAVGGNRTANAQEFVEEGIGEGLIALGIDFETIKNKYFAAAGGGVFLDGVKLDPAEVEHLLAHGGEKFGAPPEEMTEEEIAEAEAREEAEKQQEAK